MDKKKILIIDDEEAFGKMVKLNLEKTGDYDVRIETKGQEAYNVIKEFKPDMVFLDVIMPDMDGAEVAQQIKSDESLKQLPVTFLTAIVKEDEVAFEKGILAGSRYPCLAKPVTVDKLIDCIKKNVI